MSEQANDPNLSERSERRTPQAAWLHFDKSSGELCLTKYTPSLTKGELEDKIKQIQLTLEQSFPPSELCYPTEPEGKAGNEKISSLCAMCNHKHTCFPSLRSFQYSNKIVHLSKVVKVPDVAEITQGSEPSVDYGDFS